MSARQWPFCLVQNVLIRHFLQRGTPVKTWCDLYVRHKAPLPLELFGGIIFVATNSCASQTALPGQWSNGAFTTFYHTSNKTVQQQQILLFRLLLFSYFDCISELLLNNLTKVLWPPWTRFTDELICAHDFVKYRLVIWNKIGYIDVKLPPALN